LSQQGSMAQPEPLSTVGSSAHAFSLAAPQTQTPTASQQPTPRSLGTSFISKIGSGKKKEDSNDNKGQSTSPRRTIKSFLSSKGKNKEKDNVS